MIRKTIIGVLILFVVIAAWRQHICIPVFLAGLVAFLATWNHPTMRHNAKFAGTVLTLMVLGLWLTSMRYTLGYVGASSVVYFESGSYSVFAHDDQMAATAGKGIRRSRWKIFWWFSCPAMIPLTPIWMPFLAVLVPTSLLFLPCHGFPRGHCRGCGYNLTGNESGVCPECGSEVVVAG